MTAVELNVEIDGRDDAAPLLLGGSLGATLAMWEPQRAELAREYRMIRFDHRGHGLSPSPPGPYRIDDLGADVLSLMDRLGLPRASYVGLSLGGMVGQWLAINAPARIDRLILISTSANMPPPQGWHERAAAVRKAGTTAAVADGVLERWFTPGFAQERPEVVALYLEMVSSAPPEGYAACCEAIADLDLRAELSQVRAPTMVLVGAQDPSTPPAHAETISGIIPGARLERLDPGAHLLNVERQPAVTGLICEHLEQPP